MSEAPQPVAPENDNMERATSIWSLEQSDDTTNDLDELATIRVRTMFGLVEELTVREQLTRVLYLTNMQAQLFDAETVPKMLTAFEIQSSPSLVINLMMSMCFPPTFRVSVDLPELSEQEKADYHYLEINNAYGNSDSFLSREDATTAGRRLTNFFKEVLLPLAAETNAIIITSGSSQDILALTLGEVLPLFRARYGGKLPFTVLVTVTALNFAYNMLYEPSSMACELANKSKNWRNSLAHGKFERAGMLHAWFKASVDDNPKKWGRSDILPGLGNYVVIESISGKIPDRFKPDVGPFANFSNELLQALSSQLPTLCVRTGASCTSASVTDSVQLASRDIPVLMVDPEVRPPLDVVVKPGEPSTRDELIAKAIDINLVRHQELWALGKVQSYDQHDLAFFFDVLNGDGKADTTVNLGQGLSSGSEEQTLYESLRSAEADDEAGNLGGRSFTQEQLELVINHLIEMMAQTFLRVQPTITLEELAPGFDATSPEIDQIEGFNPANHWAEKLDSIWSVYYDLFMAPRMYGLNLQNLSSAQSFIDQIVKRDKLPPKNSLEAQQILRDAWNAVDICVYNAVRYKRVAKLSYVAQLLLGIVVIVFTVFREQIDEYSCEEPVDVDGSCGGIYSSSTGIFVTASLLTLVTGMTVFFSPARRWRELRAMAESMRSDVFQFRTRTGPFAVSMSEPRRPELEISARIQDARSMVVQMGGLTESSFTRQYPDKVWSHGQNKVASSQAFDLKLLSGDAPIDIEARAIVDNHHSPMKPTQYISARLIPMLAYYRSRVPRKYREWKTTVFLMLTSTISIAVLSYLNGRPGTADLSAIAGIVAGVSAALTSWAEYSGADRKINRYTNAVVAIENHLLWWNTLPAVEHNSLTNIKRLVGVGEDIKLAEVSAWADASRQNEKKDDGNDDQSASFETENPVFQEKAS
jgi:hypothetical protein